MKIHLDNVNMNSTSGPNSFAKRLAMGLLESGHDLELNDGTNADVSIVFIEPSGRPLAKKVIQRLDGIWFSPQEFETKNVNIKKLYHSADGVIWQSEFDKGMSIKWWGQPKSGKVILNGINAPIINKFQIPVLEQLRQQYEMLFVCSANWHPQKRLIDNINLYKHLRQFYSSAALIVLGSNPIQVADPHIFYAGSQPHEVCLEIFAAANWMIHLAWLDHCPNTVVEALSQNTPVICSEQGGTKELVEGYGIILKENQNYDFELTDYDNPPKIDVTQITKKLPPKNELHCSYNVTMSNCVSSYIEFIIKIVEES
jgi:glycosyltransferase involved in cell wall biosynthesis